MTPQEAIFWQRAQRRAASFAPEIRAAILRAFQIIRNSLNDADLARIVDSGNLERLFAEVFTDDVMDRAFIPYRQRIREHTASSFRYFTNDLPGAGKINGQIGVAFDYLSPNVVTAIRQLETKAIETLKGDIRDTVKAFVENGLRDGVNPRAIGREIRAIVGLAPSQEAYVENLRRELMEGRFSDAERRVLLDRRFNLSKLAEMSDAERLKRIDLITDRYRKSYTAFNAETNARTATLDSMKLGQRLSWQDAVDKGIVDGDRLQKTWVGVMDDRERPEHVAMEGETVPFDQPFTNGEMIPGDSTYNCRCIPRYTVARA